MKKFGIFLAILIGGIGGIYGYFAYKDAPDIDAFSIVPDDAIYIIHADDPIENWKTFSSSPFWTFLKKHPSLEALTEDADYLDELITENKKVFDHVGQRNFIMSAHMIGSKDYDFLFFVDLKNISKIKLSKTMLSKIVGKKYFNVYANEVDGAMVFEIYDRASKDILYLLQIENHLICSYSRLLIKKTIAQNDGGSLLQNPKFVEVNNHISNDGLCRIYLNYNQLNAYAGIYSTDTKTQLTSLAKELNFSGLSMEAEDDFLHLEGYSSLPENDHLYTRLIHKYGNNEFTFDQVLSTRTAYCQAIAFNDFKAFYSDLISSLEDSKDIQNYKRIKDKVERVLGLSLEEDFLSWIGGDVVIAQNLPSGIHQRGEDDLIVAIKTKTDELASEKLLKIQRQIKKRSPAKFKKLSYKNYPIYYLDVKGFFGLFFGKAFSKLTKPYYIQLDNYVIFSNSPTTLVSLIEDYENGTVLATNSGYEKVKNEVPNSSALFTYASGVHAYPILEKSINASELSEYRQNKKYFNFMNAIGISFTAAGNGFDNEIHIHYNVDQEDLPEQDTRQLADEYLEDETYSMEDLSDAELFVVNEVNDGDYVKYYDNSDVAKVAAKSKNGKFHGDYFEYYPSGVLKTEGRYRKGKKTGRWKYYTETGELEEKRWE